MLLELINADDPETGGINMCTEHDASLMGEVVTGITRDLPSDPRLV